jgi:hypothetical protein
MIDFYARALARITHITAALGLVGTIAALFMKGPRWALGFLVGAAISYVNFGSWKRLGESFGQTEKRPMRVSVVFLVLRYLVFAGVIYAIVKLLGIVVAAILFGLFVSIAAILLEILYELFFAR